jgi:FtsP/CotA-like multicopper oxidase with cupredoxin domain
MSAMTFKKATSMNRLLPLVAATMGLLLAGAAQAAAPGIKGSSFTLTASPAYITQPDGQSVYSWGYACSAAPGGVAAPSTIAPPVTGVCGGTMQIPGPTLIVTENVAFTVTLTNHLPTAAGNTSILFPGISVASAPTGGVPGVLTQEATPNGSVTYHLVARSPGTRAYYSGSQGDLQVEMGMYGAIIVLPSATAASLGCNPVPNTVAHYVDTALGNTAEADFRLAASAYDTARSCYDREYLFQFSEMDPNIHEQALAQVTARTGCVAGAAGCSLEVPTEP